MFLALSSNLSLVDRAEVYKIGFDAPSQYQSSRHVRLCHFFTFLQLDFIQSGAEHIEGSCAISVLGAVILALNF